MAALFPKPVEPIHVEAARRLLSYFDSPRLGEEDLLFFSDGITDEQRKETVKSLVNRIMAHAEGRPILVASPPVFGRVAGGKQVPARLGCSATNGSAPVAVPIVGSSRQEYQGSRPGRFAIGSPSPWVR